MTNGTRHIIWTGRALKVLDQRALPRRIAYRTCRSAADVAAAIRDMTLRGAPLIGCAAAYGMALAARGRSQRTIAAAGRRLLASRPTAVNLRHAVEEMLARARRLAAKDLAAGLAAAARDYHDRDLDANKTMARLGSGLLRKGSRVITYCNAGALATSGIGTAVGVIQEGFRRRKVAHVFPCETRPYLQGSRLTLWELMKAGIPSTLITDNMAAHLMSRGEVDAVIVGSDRIAANGDVCNKIGTYALAILARHHRIPFFVVAPTSTVDLRCPDGSRIPIEERSAQEVLEVAGRPIAPRGAKARHFAFDVTPARLVTAVVTERGIVSPVNARRLRHVMERKP